MDCYKVSNNKYFDCPALMSDGRQFTDYRPSCQVDSLLQVNNNIMNSFQYSNFLTNNALQLINFNNSLACKKNANSNCMNPYNVGTMLPEQYTQTCNDQTCYTKETNPTGLGLGINYGPISNISTPPNQPPNQCLSSNNIFNQVGLGSN